MLAATVATPLTFLELDPLDVEQVAVDVVDLATVAVTTVLLVVGAAEDVTTSTAVEGVVADVEGTPTEEFLRFLLELALGSVQVDLDATVTVPVLITGVITLLVTMVTGDTVMTAALDATFLEGKGGADDDKDVIVPDRLGEGPISEVKIPAFDLMLDGVVDFSYDFSVPFIFVATEAFSDISETVVVAARP